MKLLLTLALLLPMSALADPVTNRVAQCKCVMAPGSVCKVDADRYMKPGTRKFVNGGIVPAEIYNEIKRYGDGMCDDITVAHSQGARRYSEGYVWMFRNEPIDCFVPPKKK